MTRTDLLAWFYRRLRRGNDKEAHINEIVQAFDSNVEEVRVVLGGLVDLGALYATKNMYEVSYRWRRGLGVSGQNRELGVSQDRIYRSSEHAFLSATGDYARIVEGR